MKLYLSRAALVLIALIQFGCSGGFDGAPLDFTPLALTSPAEGELLNKSTIEVAGSCVTAAGPVTVSGTGVREPVVTGCNVSKFVATVNLSANEGSKSIEISQSSGTATRSGRTSIVRACPDNFALVPADANLGVPAFCISTYEMKVATNSGVTVNDGVNGGVQLDPSLYVPQSRPAGIPWVMITYANAQSECASLGSDYHLVTAQEWGAMARNLEITPANWKSNTVGSGLMYSGHSDSEISGTAVADGYAVNGSLLLSAGDGSNGFIGTGQSESARLGAEQRRRFVLSNGDHVWDVSGNAREYNDIDGLGSTLQYTHGVEAAFELFSAAAQSALESVRLSAPAGVFSPNWMYPANSNLSHSENGIGSLSLTTASGARSPYVMTRGSHASGAGHAGIFAADLVSGGINGETNIGFRCTKSL